MRGAPRKAVFWRSVRGFGTLRHPIYHDHAIDITAENVYWYAIKNTETTDLVVTWDGGTLTPVRGHSTTALQAFALLNNAFVDRRCESECRE